MENRLYFLDATCLEDEALFKKWYDRMDEKRKQKIDAMKPRKGKQLSLGAGILFKRAMEDAGIKDFEIEIREHEKPYLSGREDIFFNISHSGDAVILGISDKEIGVDIEGEKEFSDNLIRYVFNDEEIELGKEISYTRLWTMKESIMKHSGFGISLEPKKIRLFKDGDVIRAEAEKYDCKDLYLHSYIKESYQITVCTGYDSFVSITDVTNL